MNNRQWRLISAYYQHDDEARTYRLTVVFRRGEQNRVRCVTLAAGATLPQTVAALREFVADLPLGRKTDKGDTHDEET